MQTGPGDNEIIDKVLNGDQALYAHLVKRYQNFVFLIALRYTPNREDAEEIAQDYLLKPIAAWPISGENQNSVPGCILLLPLPVLPFYVKRK